MTSDPGALGIFPGISHHPKSPSAARPRFSTNLGAMQVTGHNSPRSHGTDTFSFNREQIAGERGKPAPGAPYESSTDSAESDPAHRPSKATKLHAGVAGGAKTSAPHAVHENER